jgi:hypothetical protein
MRPKRAELRRFWTHQFNSLFFTSCEKQPSTSTKKMKRCEVKVLLFASICSLKAWSFCTQKVFGETEASHGRVAERSQKGILNGFRIRFFKIRTWIPGITRG